MSLLFRYSRLTNHRVRKICLRPTVVHGSFRLDPCGMTRALHSLLWLLRPKTMLFRRQTILNTKTGALLTGQLSLVDLPVH
jgi:hypothetical protein